MMTEVRLKVQVKMAITITEVKLKVEATMAMTGTSLDDCQHPSSRQLSEGMPEVRVDKNINNLRQWGGADLHTCLTILPPLYPSQPRWARAQTIQDTAGCTKSKTQ